MKRAFFLLAATLVLSGCVFWRTSSVVDAADQTIFTYTVRAAGFEFHAGEFASEHDAIVLTLAGRKDVYRDGEVQVTQNGHAGLPFSGAVAIDRLKKTITVTATAGIYPIPNGIYRY